MMTGLILYGPPASGKSTVTVELERLGQFELFRRLKVGPGRRSEYRMASSEKLNELRERGEIIWENKRYGAIYAVDRSELMRIISNGVIPVVHLGQQRAIKALTKEKIQWVTIELTCPRSVAVERIRARGTGDDEGRLAAWDQTAPLTSPDLTIDTSVCSSDKVAGLIRDHLTDETL